MMSYKPLKALYKKAFQGSAVDIDELGHFFQKTIGVENIRHSHLIKELQLRKKNEHLADPQFIIDLYRFLHELINIEDDFANYVR